LASAFLFHVSTLSRYIARLFLTNALVLLVILSLLVLIADVSTRFDEYTLWGRALAKASAGTEPQGFAGSLRTIYFGLTLLVDVWVPRLLVLTIYMLGPVLVGALGFTCAHLVKHRELVAVLAGGQSLWRIARPMFACAAMLLLGSLVLRETVIPDVAVLLPRAERDVARQRILAMGSTTETRAAAAARARDFVLDGQGRLLYVRDFDLSTGVAKGLVVIERDQDGLMSRRITADSATWEGSAWKLENGVAMKRPNMKDAASSQVRAGQRVELDAVPMLYTDVDPTVLKLRRYESLASHLSTRQLSQVIDRYRPQQDTPQIARRIASLERTRLARFASTACIALTLLTCLPFFLRKEPSNILRQSLLCAPVAAGGLVAAMLGVMFAIPGLPAWLSVCVPVAMLIPGAIAAASSVRS
jgi:lipopolysaccharide export LptBFGC system permease protein LptF